MIRVTAGGDLELDVKVVPRASRSRLGPRLGDRIKAQIAAPPVDGEANAELCALVSKLLGVPRSAISIPRGETGRQKTLRLALADRPRAEQLATQLEQILTTNS